MARKKVVIVDQELTPTVLATIKKKKTGVGIIGLIFLFGIFGSVVYYLPDISKYVEEYFHPERKISTEQNPETPVADEKKYYSESLVITDQDITLDTFKIEGNTLTFSIKNKGNNSLNFDEYQYYLELYNDKESLLQRIKMTDILPIPSGSSSDVSYTLNKNQVSYFEFKEIQSSDYNPFTAKVDAEGKGVITCQKESETVDYLFRNNLLYAFNDIYIIPVSQENFIDSYTTFQSLASTYNEMRGVTSELVIVDEKLKFTTSIDLTQNSGTSLNINKLVYPINTEAKVIYFEMNSKGYTCK